MTSKIETKNTLNPEDIKQISDNISKTFQESLFSEESDLEGNNDQIKDLETVKIIIKEVLAVKKNLPSTTNLKTQQVHGLTKIKTLNRIFKSPLLDEYAFNIMELKRSETEKPVNMLEGLFGLAKNTQNLQNENMGTIDRIFGRKGKI